MRAELRERTGKVTGPAWTSGSGGDIREQRLHRPRHLIHEAPEVVVGLRVSQRMARELAAVLVVITPLREIVAVRQRRQRALERQDVQPVPREIEIANDRPEAG